MEGGKEEVCEGSRVMWREGGKDYYKDDEQEPYRT